MESSNKASGKISGLSKKCSNKRKSRKKNNLDPNNIKAYDEIEKQELLRAKIFEIIIGFEPFLETINIIDRFFSGATHCYHASALLRTTDNKYILIEYGNYENQNENYNNYLYYINEDGARYCYMDKEEYICDKLNFLPLYFKADIFNKHKTLEQIINELKERGSWKKNDYNLANHNCQHFIGEIIKILKAVLHTKRNQYPVYYNLIKEGATYVLKCLFEEEQSNEGTYIVGMNRPKIHGNSIMGIIGDRLYEYDLLAIQPFNGKEDIIFAVKHSQDKNFIEAQKNEVINTELREYYKNGKIFVPYYVRKRVIKEINEVRPTVNYEFNKNDKEEILQSMAKNLLLLKFKKDGEYIFGIIIRNTEGKLILFEHKNSLIEKFDNRFDNHIFYGYKCDNNNIIRYSFVSFTLIVFIQTLESQNENPSFTYIFKCNIQKKLTIKNLLVEINQYFVNENIINPQSIDLAKSFFKILGCFRKDYLCCKMNEIKDNYIAKVIKRRYDDYKKFCPDHFLEILETNEENYINDL